MLNSLDSYGNGLCREIYTEQTEKLKGRNMQLPTNPYPAWKLA